MREETTLGEFGANCRSFKLLTLSLVHFRFTNYTPNYNRPNKRAKLN